jgi:hypothetical protein
VPKNFTPLTLLHTEGPGSCHAGAATAAPPQFHYVAADPPPPHYAAPHAGPGAHMTGVGVWSPHRSQKCQNTGTLDKVGSHMRLF